MQSKLTGVCYALVMLSLLPLYAAAVLFAG